MQSFKLRIFIGITVPVLMILLVIMTALSLPYTNMTFYSDGSDLIVNYPHSQGERLSKALSEHLLPQISAS